MNEQPLDRAKPVESGSKRNCSTIKAPRPEKWNENTQVVPGRDGACGPSTLIVLIIMFLGYCGKRKSQNTY